MVIPHLSTWDLLSFSLLMYFIYPRIYYLFFNFFKLVLLKLSLIELSGRIALQYKSNHPDSNFRVNFSNHFVVMFCKICNLDFHFHCLTDAE